MGGVYEADDAAETHVDCGGEKGGWEEEEHALKYVGHEFIGG